MHIGRLICQCHNVPLTQERLSCLVSIEWFRNGAIPESHRIYFLGQLDKKKRIMMVDGILELMKANAPEESVYHNTHAFDDYSLKLLVTELLREEGGKRQRDLLRELKELNVFTQPKYFGVLSTLKDLKSSTLDFILPPSYRKYFFKDKLPFAKLREYVKFALLGLACLLPYAFTPHDDCDGEIVNLGGRDYCIATDEDRSKLATLTDPEARYFYSADSSKRTMAINMYNLGARNFEEQRYSDALTLMRGVKIEDVRMDASRNKQNDSIDYYRTVGFWISMLMVSESADTLNMSASQRSVSMAASALNDLMVKHGANGMLNNEFKLVLLARASELGYKQLALDILIPPDTTQQRVEPVPSLKISSKVMLSGIPGDRVNVSIVGAGFLGQTDSRGTFEINLPNPPPPSLSLRFDYNGEKNKLDTTVTILRGEIPSIFSFAPKTTVNSRVRPVEESPFAKFAGILGTYNGLVHYYDKQNASISLQLKNLNPNTGAIVMTGNFANGLSGKFNLQGDVDKIGVIKLQGTLPTNRDVFSMEVHCTLLGEDELSCTYSTTSDVSDSRGNPINSTAYDYGTAGEFKVSKKNPHLIDLSGDVGGKYEDIGRSNGKYRSILFSSARGFPNGFGDCVVMVGDLRTQTTPYLDNNGFLILNAKFAKKKVNVYSVNYKCKLSESPDLVCAFDEYELDKRGNVIEKRSLDNVVFRRQIDAIVEVVGDTATNRLPAERLEFVHRGDNASELAPATYVIVGVFRSEVNAAHFADGLRQRELAPANYGFLTAKGLWYVYANKAVDVEKGRISRDILKQTKVFKDAWLLVVEP